MLKKMWIITQYNNIFSSFRPEQEKTFAILYAQSEWENIYFSPKTLWSGKWNFQNRIKKKQTLFWSRNMKKVYRS